MSYTICSIHEVTEQADRREYKHKFYLQQKGKEEEHRQMLPERTRRYYHPLYNADRSFIGMECGSCGMGVEFWPHPSYLRSPTSVLVHHHEHCEVKKLEEGPQ